MEVVVASKPEEKTENAFVGGRNRWRYDTFVNWEMWWPGFPVLVYFKVREGGRQGGCRGQRDLWTQWSRCVGGMVGQKAGKLTVTANQPGLDRDTA